MDPVTMTYYAAVCAALSLGAGRLRSALLRILSGVIVGLIAAALLPDVRAALGV
jgi:hypothetical protein